MRRIRSSIEDLVRNVSSEAHVERAAADLAGEILAQLDGATVVEDKPGLDLPVVGRIPGPMLRGKRGVCGGRATPPTS